MNDQDAERQRAVKLLAADQERIVRAVAQTTFAWAHLENRLVIALSAIINDGPAGLASELYFAASNFETRFALVDRGLRFVCYGKPQVIEEWDKVLTRMNNLKKTRNKIAHGHVATVSTPSGKNAVRLTPPLFKFRDFGDAHQSKQLVGLSGADIEAHNTAVNSLSKDILAVTKKFAPGR